jgi:predicted 3-demethylubiquinone-9 3-methyltransferase (glyoxalase superfamily)
MSTIAPCLWFNGTAEEAARFYVSVFPNSAVDSVSRYGAGSRFPPGTALMVEFTLNGQRFQALNGGPEYSFSEAVSFSVPCADQSEVDHYWDALIADGGSAGRCGWLKDRFGVSWQIVPQALGRMMKAASGAQAQRTMGALMQMSKLDVAALEAAFAGG